MHMDLSATSSAVLFEDGIELLGFIVDRDAPKMANIKKWQEISEQGGDIVHDVSTLIYNDGKQLEYHCLN